MQLIHRNDEHGAVFKMSQHDFARMRKAMVESQLRTTDVNDPAIIAAMATVARENFAADSLCGVAYMDRPLPLGEGRFLSPPLALGRLLVEAGPRADDTVLIIGAATGYCAALLAPLVQSVTAVESSVTLASQARAQLAGVGNVTLVDGPLAAGAPAHAPYSLIIIDGAIGQLPQTLVDQLAEGGRVVSGVCDGSVTRLALGRKSGGAFGMEAFADCEIPVLAEFAKAKGFQF